jgi:hypothetical protein
MSDSNEKDKYFQKLKKTKSRLDAILEEYLEDSEKGGKNKSVYIEMIRDLRDKINIYKYKVKEMHKMETEYNKDKIERIQKLKEHLEIAKQNHEENILKLTSLKEAHIYCVLQKLSAQRYGPLLEKYITTKFYFQKNKAANCSGDCSKDGKNVEVKVSLGGSTHTKFNFVQLRPSHHCDIYIFTAYHLAPDNVEEEGELYIFKIPKEDIKKIIISYGGYAHGTNKEHGKISIYSFRDDKNLEFALRPTINDECWKSLLPFRISETQL